MRLFAALYPPSDVLAAARHAVDTVRGPGDLQPSTAWVPPELLHLTVAFYGEVPGGAVDELATVLTGVAGAATAMDLHLRGAGVFHDRVLWLGVGGDVEALRELSAQAARAGESVGLRLDRRPRQRAHLTVARARPSGRERPRRGRAGGSRSGSRGASDSAAEALRRYAEALSVYIGPTWRADELCLVASDLTETRPVHTVLERFALG